MLKQNEGGEEWGGTLAEVFMHQQDKTWPFLLWERGCQQDVRLKFVFGREAYSHEQMKRTSDLVDNAASGQSTITGSSVTSTGAETRLIFVCDTKKGPFDNGRLTTL